MRRGSRRAPSRPAASGPRTRCPVRHATRESGTAAASALPLFCQCPSLIMPPVFCALCRPGGRLSFRPPCPRGAARTGPPMLWYREGPSFEPYCEEVLPTQSPRRRRCVQRKAICSNARSKPPLNLLSRFQHTVLIGPHCHTWSDCGLRLASRKTHTSVLRERACGMYTVCYVRRVLGPCGWCAEPGLPGHRAPVDARQHAEVEAGTQPGPSRHATGECGLWRHSACVSQCVRACMCVCACARMRVCEMVCVEWFSSVPRGPDLPGYLKVK